MSRMIRQFAVTRIDLTGAFSGAAVMPPTIPAPDGWIAGTDPEAPEWAFAGWYRDWEPLGAVAVDAGGTCCVQAWQRWIWQGDAT